MSKDEFFLYADKLIRFLLIAIFVTTVFPVPINTTFGLDVIWFWEYDLNSYSLHRSEYGSQNILILISLLLLLMTSSLLILRKYLNQKKYYYVVLALLFVFLNFRLGLMSDWHVYYRNRSTLHLAMIFSILGYILISVAYIISHFHCNKKLLKAMYIIGCLIVLISLFWPVGSEFKPAFFYIFSAYAWNHSNGENIISCTAVLLFILAVMTLFNVFRGKFIHEKTQLYLMKGVTYGIFSFTTLMVVSHIGDWGYKVNNTNDPGVLNLVYLYTQFSLQFYGGIAIIIFSICSLLIMNTKNGLTSSPS